MMKKCRVTSGECEVEGGGVTPRHSSRIRFSAFRFRLLLCVLHSALGVSLVGCNVIGVVASRVGPAPKVPAQFTPAKTPVLVLVENFHNPASLRLEADSIARHLAEELEMKDVAPVVDEAEVAALRQKGASAYRQMPLDAIGRAVGARQIIYVDLEQFEISHALASELLGGDAAARVRVVDDAGAVLWPVNSAGGFPVSVKIQPEPVAIGTGDFAVRRKLHAALADKVAKLFYAYSSEGEEIVDEQFQ